MQNNHLQYENLYLTTKDLRAALEGLFYYSLERYFSISLWFPSSST